jgi:hypothetical protein
MAYLIEPARDVPPYVRTPGLTTNGSSAYLLDPLPLDEDELEAEDASPWPPLLQPEPAIVARPYVAGGVAAGLAAAAPPRPGAYLPPNSALPPSSVSRPVATAGPTGTNRPVPLAGMGIAPTPGSMRAPATNSHGGGGADPAPPTTGNRATPGAALAALTSAFDGIDRDRIGEIAGWFVAVGSVMSVLGFLLPWSVVVIGASGNGGYLDDWGLASPTHVLAVLVLLGVLALGILENPIPAWLRTGVIGLAVGGLLLGLTWPYTIGPLGAEVGATITFLGGFALLVGGAVASWATRHVQVDPVV